MSSARLRLKEKKDKLGWKWPYHEHFRVIKNGVDHPFNSDFPPLYCVYCAAKDCEADGCPRTESGFPE